MLQHTPPNHNASTSQVSVAVNKNKRFLAETSPEEKQEISGNLKVTDLSVENLKCIIKEVNQDIVTQLTMVKEDVKELKEENVKLKQQLQEVQTTQEMDRKRISILEEQVKNKNLILKGLQASTSITEEVKKIVCETLQLPSIAIKATKKLFENRGKMTVLVEMDSAKSVEDVLRQSKKLRGTSVYVEKDLNAEKQEEKRVMLQLKREIMAVEKTHRINVTGERIKIGTKWFRWDKQRILMCGNQNAAIVLKTMYVENYEKLNFEYATLLKNALPKN